MVEDGEKLPKEDQAESEMRYLTKKEFEALKEIPKNADSETIERFVRAFWYPPYRGAFIKLGSKIVEPLPEIVKENLAFINHSDDYEVLKKTILN